MACVNQGSHSFTCHPRVYPQVEMSVDTLWLVLISWSWPGWHGEILRWFARLKTVIHTNICRSAQELNPWPWNCKFNALTTRLPSYTCHLYSLLRRFSSATCGGIKLSGNQPTKCLLKTTMDIYDFFCHYYTEQITYTFTKTTSNTPWAVKRSQPILSVTSSKINGY